MKVYESYSEEPEDIFEPLDDVTYCELYGLEMNCFSEDFEFYANHLRAESSILEMGCGTGRLSRLLLAAGHGVTGIDLSPAMVQAARENTDGKATILQMDMRQIGFSRCFDSILVPYNTLNLLTDDTDLGRCLSGINDHLIDSGRLLVQIHVTSDEEIGCNPEKSFQFQVFDRPQGGKVIKEMVRTYQPHRQLLELEERYKIRPMTGVEHNRNYHHTLTLSWRPISDWLDLLNQYSFSVSETRSQYSGQSSTSSPIRLIAAYKQ